MNTFGSYLRKLRNLNQVSLRKAAKDIGLSPSYLSKIEQDVVDPPKEKVIRDIANYYEVAARELLNRAPNRRYNKIIQKFDSKPNKAELFVLHRMVQDDDEILYELLLEVYKKKGMTEVDLDRDIRKLRTELPRTGNLNEGLFADKIKPRHLSKKTIEDIASRELKRSGVDVQCYIPPTPIEAMIENSEIMEMNLTDEWDPLEFYEDPKILGMTRFSRKNTSQKEILVSTKLYEDESSTMQARLHFTLAHEYFHAIEHLSNCSVGVTLNRTSIVFPELSPSLKVRPSIRQRKLARWVNNNAGPKKLVTNEDWREWQANYFASALLMPKQPLIVEFKDRFDSDFLVTPDDMNIKEYAFEVATTVLTPKYICEQSLSTLFAVSAQAMAIRLMELKLVI